MELKKYTFIISLISLLLLAGCSKANSNPKDSEIVSIEEQTILFPHSETWKSMHMSYMVGNKLSGGEASCIQCHQKNNLGEPREVNCTTQCHSTKENFPVPAPIPTLLPNNCTGCHSSIVKNKYAHYPSNAGLCSTCHQVTSGHLSGNGDPVNTKDTDLDCYRCHTRKDTESVVHGALKDKKSCIACHNPHGGEQRFYIKAESTKELCLNCHDTAVNAAVKHGPVIKGKSCINCHKPHSAKHSKLLLLPSKELCLSCHNREITATLNSPRTLPDIKEKLEMKSQHTGATMGDCTACHYPHGSKNNRLLTAGYSLANYNKYSEANYAICFNCHDPSAISDKNSTATGFRSGNFNQHWFHVVDAAGSQNKSQGRSCKICHDPHGAPQDFSINKTWYMDDFPINISYTQTKTGGQCTLTCHDVRIYSRE